MLGVFLDASEATPCRFVPFSGRLLSKTTQKISSKWPTNYFSKRSFIFRPNVELTFGQYIKIAQVWRQISPKWASLGRFLAISNATKWGYPDVGGPQDIGNCQYFMIMTVWGVQPWRSKKAQPFETSKFLVNIHKGSLTLLTQILAIITTNSIVWHMFICASSFLDNLLLTCPIFNWF